MAPACVCNSHQVVVGEPTTACVTSAQSEPAEWKLGEPHSRTGSLGPHSGWD